MPYDRFINHDDARKKHHPLDSHDCFVEDPGDGTSACRASTLATSQLGLFLFKITLKGRLALMISFANYVSIHICIYCIYCIYLSTYPAIYLSIYLSICLSVCLFVCLSVCLSIYLSLFVNMYTCIFTYKDIVYSIQTKCSVYPEMHRKISTLSLPQSSLESRDSRHFSVILWSFHAPIDTRVVATRRGIHSSSVLNGCAWY